MKYENLQQRLLLNSAVDPETGCWIWLGPVDHKGYGRICMRVPEPKKKHRRKSTVVRFPMVPRNFSVHRVAYELFKETKIPEGMTLDHTCRQRPCFNPEHLDVCTVTVNIIRRDIARRAAIECCGVAHF